MRLHRLMLAAVVGSVAVAGVASAQTPGVLYSWDHSYGSALGSSIEGWSYGFGAGATTLGNASNGVLTVTESVAGGDWAISDGFNVAKESAANASGGFFDFGGTDLSGLTEFELDIAHNGSTSISGQLFFQPDNGSGCCGFLTSSSFTVNPGSMNTVSVNLAGSGITADQLEHVRAIGVQIFGHAEPAPLTWEISELRTTGPGLSQRVIADYTTAPANLANAVVKFDNLAISGAPLADSQNGLSLFSNSLRWIDLGGTGDAGDESGGAVAWGNGNKLAVDFTSRPLDISNYDFAEVTMKATPGAGGASEVGVQFYAQYADRAANNGFAYGGTSLVLPADGQYHTLAFPLAALGASGLDLTQWIGLNLDPHAGGSLQIQVESVVLTTIPEPTAAVLMALACAVGAMRLRV